MADEKSPVPEERFTNEPAVVDKTQDSSTEETPALVVNGQYIKDFSFEAPNTPDVYNLLQSTMPTIQVDIDVQGEGKGDALFEVILKVRAEAIVGDKVAYICELSYAGLFSISVPPEHLGPVLLIECPLILFPFLRRIISNVTGDGGFAPLMLSPIDFSLLYQQRIMEAQANDTPEAEK
jgi:preprotein translocase subunit SecB